MSHNLAPAERAPIPLRPIETDAGRAASVPFCNLPRALTSLIGRDADIAAARALLVERRPRLITLTGPGGVGKTRLAVEIADDVAAAFPDDVVFVPLAPITDPDLVLSAIARVFGLLESGGQTVADLLVNRLRHRQSLLILDNVEQVVGAAPLIAALLGDCPGLTILATSRSRLHVSGEHRLPVSPLALSPDGVHSLAAVAASPAIQLFIERAQAVDPSFILNEGNAEAVAAICRRLDGLPLTIELAAVRMQLLTPEELLAHLEPALPLLTAGPQDAPDRLRTMRNAIAWSYDLLSPAEQALLQRLSVFVGGCALEAAEWVGASSDTLETVAALVDASLVQRHDVSGETRLTMMETIREFASERLAASGEQDAIADSHAAWCVQLAETVRRSGALSRREGLDRLETEHPNLRAALHWFLANGQTEAALHLAGELAEFWLRRGHLAEGIAGLERILTADSGPPTAARANALVGLNMLLWARAARPHARGSTGPRDDESGVFSRPLRLLDEAEAVARAAGDAGALAYARLHQGYVAFFRGDLDLAETRGIEGLETFAVIPQGFGLDGVYWLLAEAALARGDDELAGERFTRLLELAHAGGDEISLANALGGLALLAERRGELGVALRGFTESAAVCRGLGDRLHAGQRLEQAAVTATAAGYAASAIRLFAAADAQRVITGLGTVRLDISDYRRPERSLAMARAELSEEAFATHWAAGAALSLDEAIAELQMLADQVIARFSNERAMRPAALTTAERKVSLAPIARSGTKIADEWRRYRGDDWQLPTPLTERERDVLFLLADGVGDKAIAMALGISRRTASQHVAAILGKLGAESRTAAVSIALREGLLASSLLNYA